MTDTALGEAVFDRLDRLESLNRSLRRRLIALTILWIVSCLAGSVAVFLTYVNFDSSIWVMKFWQKSREAVLEGLLQERCVSKTPQGDRLALQDADGQTRISLLATKDGCGMGLFDKSGTERLSLTFSSEMSSLFFRDVNGKAQAAVHASPLGAFLVLHDDEGKPRVSVLRPHNGSDGFKIVDQTGKTGAEITAKGNKMKIALYDGEGNPLFVQGD
jgi:hypothetical protein